jgi:tetratricopeptide (TPR) repeat protein
MIKINSLKSVITSLRAKEKYKQAQELLDHFFTQASCIADYDTLGECAIEAQYHELRLKCANYVYTHVTQTDQLFLARQNLYECYNALNYPEKALFYIELNLKIKPNDSDTLMHKGFNLALLGKRKEAEEIIENVSTTNKKLLESLEYSLSGKLLREGKTAKGIISFIAAFKPKNYLFEDQLKLKFWDGAPQPGKTIVVNGEGGIGDEIINIRFLDNLKKLGMNPILYSSWYNFRPDTVDLFRRHGYKVVTNNLFFKKDYLWTHMMALPGYLGLTESQLWKGPYLYPQHQQKNQLSDKKFKIGIKCNGNPYFEQDLYRSIPINELLDIMPTNTSIYYFDLNNEYQGTLSLKDKINSWEDTLDLIDQMDIIVSSCTSLVHAAGAIGKRTIVIVPIAKYYVWTSSRSDTSTPWYGDNFTVLEQTNVRSWKEPLEQARLLIEKEYENFNNGIIGRREDDAS